MSSEKMGGPAVLVVPKGSIDAAHRVTIMEAGVLLVECDNPERVRFMTPSAELDSCGLLDAAMSALSLASPSIGDREFVERVAALAERQRREAGDE